MRLIITTNRGVRLLDTESWEENALVESNRGFYGVSWDQEHIYIVKDFQSPHPEICVLNKRFDCVNTLDMEERLIKPHQIVVNSGKLWVADAGKNALTVYDLTTGAVSDHLLPDTGGDFGKTLGKNHFNSLTFKNDLLYICAHNGSVPSTILVLDRDLKEVGRFNMGVKAHNIALNGGITICNSERGSVECCDQIYHRTTGFTRGLAQTDEEIIFGVSMRAKRHRRPGGVDGAMIGFIRDDATEMVRVAGCSQIYEIRVLDKFDYGHGVKPFL